MKPSCPYVSVVSVFKLFGASGNHRNRSVLVLILMIAFLYTQSEDAIGFQVLRSGSGSRFDGSAVIRRTSNGE